MKRRKRRAPLGDNEQGEVEVIMGDYLPLTGGGKADLGCAAPIPPETGIDRDRAEGVAPLPPRPGLGEDRADMSGTAPAPPGTGHDCDKADVGGAACSGCRGSSMNCCRKR